MRKHDREFVSALEKGLMAIEAFSAESPELTISEVAKHTGVTRAAARRYLLTLAKLGYADYDGRLFRLAPRVLKLGYSYLSASPFPKLAQPALEMIGSKTQDIASLALLDGNEVVFLARSTSRRLFSAWIGIGTRLPAVSTATGRVLLAAKPDPDVQRYLRALRPKRYTDKTKTSYAALLAEIRKVRQQGFSINDEEVEVGLRSIAVPVTDSKGAVPVALTVSVQSARMTAHQMVSKLLPVLREGSKDMSSLL